MNITKSKTSGAASPTQFVAVEGLLSPAAPSQTILSATVMSIFGLLLSVTALLECTATCARVEVSVSESGKPNQSKSVPLLRLIASLTNSVISISGSLVTRKPTSHFPTNLRLAFFVYCVIALLFAAPTVVPPLQFVPVADICHVACVSVKSWSNRYAYISLTPLPELPARVGVKFNTAFTISLGFVYAETSKDITTFARSLADNPLVCCPIFHVVAVP